MTIKLLDPKLVSLIAAGEVVERPASVVKELVENSLDAGSSQISVEAKGGGVGLIRITDNGTGIPPKEIELAFNRYATSKIGDLEDLKSISTLGFRGEALPSIAAVAEVDIVTCTAGELAGNYLNLREGAVIDRGSQGRSQGTTITVRNLFRKVPARLKFLKSSATENSHIANIVSQYALAFPEIKFALLIDGRTALRTAGSGQLIDSLTQVCGLEIARTMLEIGGANTEWESGMTASSLSVTGMVGSPAVSRSNRNYLNLFVNRRWISSRLLSWAVKEAYHGLLMKGKHPVAVINISLPPGEVDVNVHPAKTEVKFQNEHAVFGAVQKVVRRTLIELAPVLKIEEVSATYGAPSTTRPLSGKLPLDTARPAASPLIPQTPMLSLPVLRILGQLLSSYIIAEGSDGLYLIDQHAAHERILFEKIKHQRSQQEIKVQGLLDPATFEVNPRQEEVLKSHSGDLAEFGFSIELFGDRAYLVRAVPVLLYQKDWAGMLRELLDSFSGGDNRDWREEAAISMACHSAVRAGQALTDDEMRELIRQLEQAALPHSCPHGRPTMIHLSSAQLGREFGRS